MDKYLTKSNTFKHVQINNYNIGKLNILAVAFKGN